VNVNFILIQCSRRLRLYLLKLLRFQLKLVYRSVDQVYQAIMTVICTACLVYILNVWSLLAVIMSVRTDIICLHCSMYIHYLLILYSI